MKSIVLCVALISLLGCVASKNFAPSRSLQTADTTTNSGNTNTDTTNTNNGNTNTDNTNNNGGNTTPVTPGAAPSLASFYLGCVLTLAYGLFMSFFGYRAFKIAVFILAFLSFASSYVTTQAPAGFFTYVVAAVIGAIAGLVTLYCLKVAYFMLGGITALIVVMVLLWKFSLGAGLGFIVYLGSFIGGGIVGIYFFQIVIIIGTSLIGGVSVFGALMGLMSGALLSFNIATGLVILNGLIMLVVFGLGTVKQWRDWRIDENVKQIESNVQLQDVHVMDSNATSVQRALYTQNPQRPAQQQF